MNHLSLEDFNQGDAQMDSLYRLVDLAARRANQLNKPESRALVSGAAAKKPVIVALEEILEGKVGYLIGDAGDDEYDIG